MNCPVSRPVKPAAIPNSSEPQGFQTSTSYPSSYPLSYLYRYESSSSASSDAGLSYSTVADRRYSIDEIEEMWLNSQEVEGQDGGPGGNSISPEINLYGSYETHYGPLEATSESDPLCVFRPESSAWESIRPLFPSYTEPSNLYSDEPLYSTTSSVYPTRPAPEVSSYARVSSFAQTCETSIDLESLRQTLLPPPLLRPPPAPARNWSQAFRTYACSSPPPTCEYTFPIPSPPPMYPLFERPDSPLYEDVPLVDASLPPVITITAPPPSPPLAPPQVPRDEGSSPRSHPGHGSQLPQLDTPALHADGGPSRQSLPIKLKRPSRARTETASLATPFISILWHLITHEEFERFIRWSDNGTHVVLDNTQEFATTVQPRFFRSSTFGSFTRQMNIYRFQRWAITQVEPDSRPVRLVTFSHPNFVRDRPELIVFLKPTTGTGPRKSTAASGEVATIGQKKGTVAKKAGGRKTRKKAARTNERGVGASG